MQRRGGRSFNTLGCNDTQCQSPGTSHGGRWISSLFFRMTIAALRQFFRHEQRPRGGTGTNGFSRILRASCFRGSRARAGGSRHRAEGLRLPGCGYRGVFRSGGSFHRDGCFGGHRRALVLAHAGGSFGHWRLCDRDVPHPAAGAKTAGSGIEIDDSYGMIGSRRLRG